MESPLIVKEGALVKSRNHGVRLAFLKAQWVPRYFVLRRTDHSGHYVLDQYWKKSKRKIKKTLELSRCTKVESYLKLSESAARHDHFEWIFAIHYTKREANKSAKLFLAATSKEEMDSWVFELCRCCKFLGDDTDSYMDSSSTPNGVTPLFDRSKMSVARLPLATDFQSEDSFLVDTPMSECGTGVFGITRMIEDATSLPATARPKDVPRAFDDDEERERFFVVQFPTSSARKCTVRSSPLVSPSNENPPSAIGIGPTAIPSISLATPAKVTQSSNYIHIKECGSLPRRMPPPQRMEDEEDGRPNENNNPYMHLNKCSTIPTKPRERFVRSGAGTLPLSQSTVSYHNQKPSSGSVSAFSNSTSLSSIVHTDPETESSSGFDSFGSAPPPLPPKLSGRSSVDSFLHYENRSTSRDSRDSPPLPLAPPIPLNLDMAVPAQFPEHGYEIDTSGETVIHRRSPSTDEPPVKTPSTAPPIDRSKKPARIHSTSRSNSSQSNPASPLTSHTSRPNVFTFREVERIVPIIPRTNPQNRLLNKQLTTNDLFPHRPHKPLPLRESHSLCPSPSVSRAHNARNAPPPSAFVLDYFEPQSPRDGQTPPPELDSSVPCAPRTPRSTAVIEYVEVDQDRTQALKFATVERNAL